MSNTGLSGSFIIGGLLLLSLMGLFYGYRNFTSSKNANTIVQSSSIELKKVIDYDFNKIGYRTPKKILAINVKSISFQADLDNNGIVDTVQYTFTSDLTRSVKNPVAKSFLYHGIDNFVIVGFDSLGQQTYQPNLIKNISVKMYFNGKDLLTDTTFTALSYLEARYNLVN